MSEEVKAEVAVQAGEGEAATGEKAKLKTRHDVVFVDDDLEEIQRSYYHTMFTTGRLTVVCVSLSDDGTMKACDIPEEIASKIEAAPVETLAP